MKARLLDLFCGAVAILNSLCYNKVWIKLNVCIVAKKLRLNVRQRKYAQLGLSKGCDWAYLKRGIAYFVERRSLLARVIITGDIALSLVPRKRLLKRHWLGMKPTQRLWRNITRIVWSKTLVYGEISTITKGWKLYEYWGANA